jgi:hypothetical protein
LALCLFGGITRGRNEDANDCNISFNVGKQVRADNDYILGNFWLDCLKFRSGLVLGAFIQVLGAELLSLSLPLAEALPRSKRAKRTKTTGNRIGWRRPTEENRHAAQLADASD